MWDQIMTDKIQNSHRYLTSLLLAGVGLLTSLSLLAGEATAGQADIDNETCLMCHEGHGGSISRTGHTLGGSSGVTCTSCHTGAEVHVDDPSKDNITNPANALQSDTEKICTTCHQPHPGLGMVGQDPHAGQQISCTGCHSIHKPAKAGEMPCRKCHVAVTHQFQQRSNHPLVEGTVSCVSCHDFLGKEEPMLGHGPSANCYTCHTDQSGPFLFEHEATSSFSAEGSEGCVACHNPHGSANDRLLAQPGANLCKQCHGMLGGHLTAHDGQFGQVACVDCHSDIHGSYDNLFLLDPQLGTKFGRDADGCFCHYYR
jgi:DmsE family decaheme c-type cytochrome